MAKELGVDYHTLDGKEVFDQADNNEVYKKYVDEYYRTLAMGIYNLQYAYDPSMIIIGGAISSRSDLLDKVNEQLDIIFSQLTHAHVRPNIKVCQFGNDANLIGATYHYIQDIKEDFMNKAIPKINTQLRSHTILVPEVYREATGVLINGKRIKSLVFSTDVAVIANCNADAVIAVYPFTPTIQITEAIISVAQRPVFVGVGGGTTAGKRVESIALDAELHGATAVV